MHDEDETLTDLGITIDDVALALDDLASPHPSEDVLSDLATASPESFSADAHALLVDHVLNCATCYRQFAVFHLATSSAIVVPAPPATFQEKVRTLAGEWQSRRLVLVVAIVGRLVRVRQQRTQLRYRSPSLAPNSVDIPPGTTGKIPQAFGDYLFDLVLTHAEDQIGTYHVCLTPREDYERTVLASLELVLRDASGDRIDAAGSSDEGFRLRASMSAAAYRLTLEDRQTGAVVGLIDIVPEPVEAR